MESKQIIEKLAELKTAYTDTAKKLFSEGTKELFNKHLKLDSFGFRAYSPYFNDGDECTYSIHADIDYGLYVNGFNKDGEEFDDFSTRKWDGNIWPNFGQWDYSNGYQNKVWVEGDPEIDLMIKDVSEFINSFPDEIWEGLIGNHVSVRISRDGIETEDYSSHD